MKKQASMIKSEKGSVLLNGLLIVLLVTVIGMAAATTSSLELRISKNQKLYKQNFYLAEAAVIECAKNIEEGEPDDLNGRDPIWLSLPTGLPDFPANFPDGIEDPDAYLDAYLANLGDWSDNYSEGVVGMDSASRLLALDEGVAERASLDMTAPSTVHSYLIYGRSNLGNGQVIIKLGFRRRF